MKIITFHIWSVKNLIEKNSTVNKDAKCLSGCQGTCFESKTDNFINNLVKN